MVTPHSARLASVVAELHSLKDSAGIEGRARFGIVAEQSLGITTPTLRAMGKRLGRDQKLAEALWRTRIHDARILASLVGDPKAITSATMDRWTANFQSWDICDACCGNLFDRTPFAYQKPYEWATSEKEFVRRAAFSLIAYLSVHDKKAADQRFLDFLPLIEAAAPDRRNYVWKAVHWALRQIGKRNAALHGDALEVAYRLRGSGDPGSRRVASEAIRELESEAVRARLSR